MREYWNMHDTLQNKISTLKATNKEQADRIKELEDFLSNFCGSVSVTVPKEILEYLDIQLHEANELLTKAKQGEK